MGQLYQTTAALLQETRKPYDVIAQDTGLSERWIYDVAGEKMKDPGVNKVEALYIYLTGVPLRLVDIATPG